MPNKRVYVKVRLGTSGNSNQVGILKYNVQYLENGVDVTNSLSFGPTDNVLRVNYTGPLSAFNPSIDLLPNNLGFTNSVTVDQSTTFNLTFPTSAASGFVFNSYRYDYSIPSSSTNSSDGKTLTLNTPDNVTLTIVFVKNTFDGSGLTKKDAEATIAFRYRFFEGNNEVSIAGPQVPQFIQFQNRTSGDSFPLVSGGDFDTSIATSYELKGYPNSFFDATGAIWNLRSAPPFVTISEAEIQQQGRREVFITYDKGQALTPSNNKARITLSIRFFSVSGQSVNPSGTNEPFSVLLRDKNNGDTLPLENGGRLDTELERNFSVQGYPNSFVSADGKKWVLRSAPTDFIVNQAAINTFRTFPIILEYDEEPVVIVGPKGEAKFYVKMVFEDDNRNRINRPSWLPVVGSQLSLGFSFNVSDSIGSLGTFSLNEEAIKSISQEADLLVSNFPQRHVNPLDNTDIYDYVGPANPNAFISTTNVNNSDTIVLELLYVKRNIERKLARLGLKFTFIGTRGEEIRPPANFPLSANLFHADTPSKISPTTLTQGQYIDISEPLNYLRLGPLLREMSKEATDFFGKSYTYLYRIQIGQGDVNEYDFNGVLQPAANVSITKGDIDAGRTIIAEVIYKTFRQSINEDDPDPIDPIDPPQLRPQYRILVRYENGSPAPGKVYGTQGYVSTGDTPIISYLETITYSFSDLSGYITPDSITITGANLPEGQVFEYTVVYRTSEPNKPKNPTLTINTNYFPGLPSGYPGGDLYLNGKKVGTRNATVQVTPGEYFVRFGDISVRGYTYTTPEIIRVVIGLDQSKTVLGTYNGKIVPPAYWLKPIDNIDSQKYRIKIEEGLFSNNIKNLVKFFTTSSGAVLDRYYKKVYHEATTVVTSSAQFTISYGHFGGSGSADEGGQINDTPSRAVYGQYRNKLLEGATTKFNLSGTDTDHFYAINYQSNRLKDGLDPGVLEVNIRELSGSAFIDGGGSNRTHTGSNVQLAGTNNVIRLIDDSSINTNVEITSAGPVYNIISGNLETGAYNESNPHYYGKMYPLHGVVLLDANKLDMSSSFETVTGSEVPGDNENKLFTAISGAALLSDTSGDYLGMKARRVVYEFADFYFIRVGNKEFNYSNNPSYVTGSEGEIVPQQLRDNSRTYITTIGLYNKNRELLAVGKLTKPILKDFCEESIFTVKLKY